MFLPPNNNFKISLLTLTGQRLLFLNQHAIERNEESPPMGFTKLRERS